LARSSWLMSRWCFIAPYLNVTASGSVAPCSLVKIPTFRRNVPPSRWCGHYTASYRRKSAAGTFTVIHLSCSCISNILQIIVGVSEDGGGRLRRNVGTCQSARQYIVQDRRLKCDSPLQSSGHYMYRTVVTICTKHSTTVRSAHTVFMCFVWI